MALNAAISGSILAEAEACIVTRIASAFGKAAVSLDQSSASYAYLTPMIGGRSHSDTR
jgi:hypothetical protein